MKFLWRTMLVLLCVALLASVWLAYFNTTVSAYGHNTYYLFRWPWLHEARQWSLYGILGWCILFARSETAFVRLGLITVILSMAVVQMNPVKPFRFFTPEKAKLLDGVSR